MKDENNPNSNVKNTNNFPNLYNEGKSNRNKGQDKNSISSYNSNSILRKNSSHIPNIEKKFEIPKDKNRNLNKI